MLKRQRLPSPPPPSSVPLIADLPDDTLTSRDYKRRRTLPPPLDGPSRGWNHPPVADTYEEEDYELSEDDDEAGGPDERQPDCNVPYQAEYKSANNVLRELHTLNQHRLMFTPPPTKLPCPYNSRHAPYTTPIPTTPDLYAVGKTHMPHLSERLQGQAPSISDAHSEIHRNGATSGDESSIVTERYEGTNRFLGSLFLSRRRELGIASYGHLA